MKHHYLRFQLLGLSQNATSIFFQADSYVVAPWTHTIMGFLALSSHNFKPLDNIKNALKQEGGLQF